MVTLGRSLARAGRAAGNDTMQAIGTRVHGAGLICLGQLAEGTALMEAALPPAGPDGGDAGCVEEPHRSTNPGTSGSCGSIVNRCSPVR
jgi:hypothetical protein